MRVSEDRLDVGRLQQGHIAIGHDHMADEVAQHVLGGAHGVAGAQRRILNGDAVGAEALFNVSADFRRVGADHDDDAFAAQSLGRVDGVVQHGARADRVQHLGQGRLHARALAGGEDDGGSRMRLGMRCGHESIRQLVVACDLAHCRGLREPGDR